MQRSLVGLASSLGCALLLPIVFAGHPAPTPAATVAPLPAIAQAATMAPGTPTRAAAVVPASTEAAPARTREARAQPKPATGAPTLVERPGQGPDSTVVRRFGGKPCGSVSRSGRTSPATERREPLAHQAPGAPDPFPLRDTAADGRPLTVDAAADPVRLTVLRC